MRSTAFLMVLTILMFSACTRRPVQKDVKLDNNSAGSRGADRVDLTSSPGAADAPYELQFLDTMIAHHEVSIDTLQLAATRAQHSEVKQFARASLNDQRKEMADMRGMRSAWFGDARPAINVDLPGMQEMVNGVDLNKLDLLKEAAFDLEFLRQMTVQNESSVKLANDSLQKSLRPELTSFSEKIVNARSSETDKLRGWEREWTR